MPDCQDSGAGRSDRQKGRCWSHQALSQPLQKKRKGSASTSCAHRHGWFTNPAPTFATLTRRRPRLGAFTAPAALNIMRKLCVNAASALRPPQAAKGAIYLAVLSSRSSPSGFRPLRASPRSKLARAVTRGNSSYFFPPVFAARGHLGCRPQKTRPTPQAAKAQTSPCPLRVRVCCVATQGGNHAMANRENHQRCERAATHRAQWRSTGELIAAAFALNRLEFLPDMYSDVVEAWDRLDEQWQGYVTQVRRCHMHLIEGQ